MEQETLLARIAELEVCTGERGLGAAFAWAELERRRRRTVIASDETSVRVKEMTQCWTDGFAEGMFAAVIPYRFDRKMTIPIVPPGVLPRYLPRVPSLADSDIGPRACRKGPRAVSAHRAWRESRVASSPQRHLHGAASARCDNAAIDSTSLRLLPDRKRELTQIIFVPGMETTIGTSVRLPDNFANQVNRAKKCVTDARPEHRQLKTRLGHVLLPSRHESKSPVDGSGLAETYLQTDAPGQAASPKRSVP